MKRYNRYSLIKGFLFLGLLLISSLGYAQSTVVSGTVTDNLGQVWSNGSITAVFYGTPGYPPPFNWSGGTYNPYPPTVTLSATGTFSITLPSNNAIAPGGSQWTFTVCPNATFTCASVNIPLTTPTLNISTNLTAVIGSTITQPIVQPTPVDSAYGNSEVKTPPAWGHLYFDTSLKALKVWNGISWVQLATGGLAPTIQATTSVLKGDGIGNALAAVDGTDFLSPLTGVAFNPLVTQKVTQPPGTSLNINTLNTVFYSNNYTTLPLAIAAACNGTNPGTLILPVGVITITAALPIPANCTITGQGSSKTIVQANATLTGVVFAINTANVILRNFTLDGNRASNSNAVDCLDITTGATNVYVDGVTRANCLNQGTLIAGNVSYITLINGSAFNSGPTTASSQGTAGITISVGPSSHIAIINEHIFSNSAGINVTNSTTSGQDMADMNFTGNIINNNANDAIVISTTTFTGGNITGIRVENNEIFCNGWPPNGTGFPTSCNATIGISQNGATASGGGVGVDLIQQGTARIVRPIVSGNNIHDNMFEGLSPTTNVTPIVNTSGLIVTWVSGPQFDTTMVAGEVLTINGVNYALASVSSATSLTLATGAGTQTGVITNFPAYMGAMISNNTVARSGNNSIGTGVGPCFYEQYTNGDIYTGNIATNCNFEGFENLYGNFVSYTGDKAYGNNISGSSGRNAGFINYGGVGNTYVNIAANDPSSSPTQTIGIIINALAKNSLVVSSALIAATPISNLSSTTSQILNGGFIPNLGISSNGPGFKHVVLTLNGTGSVLNQQSSTTLTWTTPFIDNSYTLSCTLESASNTASIGINNKTASGAIVIMTNIAANANSGFADCIAVHAF